MKKFNREEIKARIKNNYLYKRTIENRYFLFFLILLIIFISYNYFSKGFIYDLSNKNLDDLINYIRSYGSLSWLIYMLIVIMGVLLAPILGSIINASGGIIFSHLNAVLLTLIGNFIGSSLAYLIAKRYAGFYFERLIGEKKLVRFQKYSEKYGAFVLFILRLNPLTSTDIFSYLAGVLGMSYKRFIISTILGITPMIVVVTYLGNIFIKENPYIKLLFLIITLVYVSFFLYISYKIGKRKVKERLEKFRK